MQEYSIYEHKYNKYKNKYLKLRKINQFGGGNGVFIIDLKSSNYYLPNSNKKLDDLQKLECDICKSFNNKLDNVQKQNICDVCTLLSVEDWNKQICSNPRIHSPENYNKIWEKTIWKKLSTEYSSFYIEKENPYVKNFYEYSIKIPAIKKAFFGRPPHTVKEKNETTEMGYGGYIPLPVLSDGEPFNISFKHFFIEFDTTTKKYKITTEKERPSGWTVLLQRKDKGTTENPKDVTIENPKGDTLELGDIIKIGSKDIHLTVRFTYLK